MQLRIILLTIKKDLKRKLRGDGLIESALMELGLVTYLISIVVHIESSQKI